MISDGCGRMISARTRAFRLLFPRATEWHCKSIAVRLPLPGVRGPSARQSRDCPASAASWSTQRFVSSPFPGPWEFVCLIGHLPKTLRFRRMDFRSERGRRPLFVEYEVEDAAVGSTSSNRGVFDCQATIPKLRSKLDGDCVGSSIGARLGEDAGLEFVRSGVRGEWRYHPTDPYRRVVRSRDAYQFISTQARAPKARPGAAHAGVCRGPQSVKSRRADVLEAWIRRPSANTGSERLRLLYLTNRPTRHDLLRRFAETAARRWPAVRGHDEIGRRATAE